MNHQMFMYQQQLAAQQNHISEWTPVLHPIQSNEDQKDRKAPAPLSLQAQIKSVTVRPSGQKQAGGEHGDNRNQHKETIVPMNAGNGSTPQPMFTPRALILTKNHSQMLPLSQSKGGNL